METSVNYNRMTTIFFISGIIVMASLYTALPLTSVFVRFYLDLLDSSLYVYL